MTCIVCDLNSVDEDRGEDAEDDLDLELVYHRKLLLSIFCKYFNWENDYSLTPSQLLSWIPSSSSSAASNFPFCIKCEEKMNELNDLHNSLAKIQLSISTLISSMSMEIIKVVESSSFSSPCQTENHQHDTKATISTLKQTSSKSPIATTTTSTNENKGARSSRRLQAKENEVQIVDSQSQDYEDDGFKFKTTKNKSKSLSKSKTREPTSVKEFRKNVYKRFKPDVIVQDCKETENPKINSTTTHSPSSKKNVRRAKLKSLEYLEKLRTERAEQIRRRQEREEKERAKQILVNMTMASNTSNDLNTNTEEYDTMTIKNEPDVPSPAFSPVHGDTFDNDFQNEEDVAPSSAADEGKIDKYSINAKHEDQEGSNAMDTGTGHKQEGGQEDGGSNGKGVKRRIRTEEDYVRLAYASLKNKKGYKNLPNWKLMELARANPRRPRPKVKVKEPTPPPPPVSSSSENEEDEEEEEEDDDDYDSDFDPNPPEKKVPQIHHAKETEPGSGIFRYVNWEFVKISETAYKCLTCDIIQNNKDGKTSMIKHINKLHNDVRPRCETCGNNWATQEQKDQHQCKSKRVKVAQEVSPGQFQYLNKYLYQKVDKNSNEKGYEFMCFNESCRRLTRTEHFMHTHIRQSHDGSNSSYICDECGRAFLTLSMLKSHKDTHSEDLNKICDVCGKGFKSQSSLYVHRQIHQGPFVCGFQGCDKQYSGQNNLKRHRIAAGHPAEKKQITMEECPNCGKHFVGEARLAKHMASLICVIQKINCHFCAKEMQPGNLSLHLRQWCPQNPDYPERMKKTNENVLKEDAELVQSHTGIKQEDNQEQQTPQDEVASTDGL